jgi:o-succinylbenzoate synthase
VKIARAHLRSFRLRLRAELVTARGPIRERQGVLLALESDSGLTAYGEATPIGGFGLESFEESERALEGLARGLLGRDPSDGPSLLEEARARAPRAPVARAALDAALHDLQARAEGWSLAALLSGGAARLERGTVPVNALISGCDPAEVEARARAAALEGYGTLKLKLGARSLAEDELRVAALRRGAGAEPKLRLDAGGAWDEKTAGEVLARLARFEIEFVEQPVAAADVSGLARLRASSPIALAADEAAVSESDAARVIESHAADVIIVKPSAAGGLQPAARIAARARHAGLGVVVTSLLDSAVAVAAALHFSASLEGELPACGLATGSLFERDLAQLPQVRDGRLSLPPGPGLGVVPDADALEAAATGPWREMGS